MTKKRLFMLYLLIPSIALVVLESYPFVYSDNEILNTLYKVIATRTVGCLVFIPLSIYMGYNIFGITKRNRAKTLAFVLIPLAVVVNNLPIIGLLSGAAYVTEPKWFIAVFALESLMIGMFEEFAFRGVLFAYVLENKHFLGYCYILLCFWGGSSFESLCRGGNWRSDFTSRIFVPYWRNVCNRVAIHSLHLDLCCSPRNI